MNVYNGNLIYKETNKIRSFLSENFTYILDKESHTSILWGKTKDDDLDFNPIGPETITIVVDSSYKFDSNQIERLTSIKTPNEDDKTSYISTVSHAILDFKDDVFSNDAAALIDFFKERSVFVSILNPIVSLKNSIKLKAMNIDEVILSYDLNKMTNDALTLLDNGIKVTVRIDLTSDNIESLYDFLNEYGKLANIELSSEEPSMIGQAIDIIKKLNIVNAVIRNTNEEMYGKTYDVLTLDFDASLFSCIFDFRKSNEVVRVSLLDDKNLVKINKIKTIYDYWMSAKFKKFRSKLLKKKYA